MTDSKAGSVEGFLPIAPERATAYRAAGYWAGRSIDSLLRETALNRPEHPAVIDDDGALTYRELDAAADRAAVGFQRLGINPGDRVLLQLPNRNSFAKALFGLLRARALPVMCLPGHRDAELSHFIDVSQASALVIADEVGGFDYRAMAAGLAARHRGLRHIVVDGEHSTPFRRWDTLLEHTGFRTDSGAPTQTDLPALLLVSGGTTAAPKLIPRTHDDYVYNATAAAQLCQLTRDDVYLVALPAGHNFALACPGLLGAVGVGATTVFLSDPSPEAAFDIIARHNVTVTSLVPSLAQLWARATEWEPVQPKSLRLLQVGGARLEPAEARRVRETLTPGLQQVFGMAEGLVCFTRPGDRNDILDNTQGRPLSEADEIRVVDPDDPEDAEVEPGEIGELLVRGPYTIGGYYRAPADNARSFTADGYYRSGDQVRKLPGGYLEVTGRIKDVILRGGESIAAQDLETHLRNHPSVSEAAAIGIPDEYLGETVCAAIIFDGEPATLAELNDHLRIRGAATHTRLDRVVAVSTLPLTAVGKIDKRALRTSLRQSARSTR